MDCKRVEDWVEKFVTHLSKHYINSLTVLMSWLSVTAWLQLSYLSSPPQGHFRPFVQNGYSGTYITMSSSNKKSFNIQNAVRKLFSPSKDNTIHITRRMPDRPVPPREDSDRSPGTRTPHSRQNFQRAQSFGRATTSGPSVQRTSTMHGSTSRPASNSHEAKMAEINRLREIRKREQLKELRRELTRFVVCPKCDRKFKTVKYDICFCEPCRFAFTFPHINRPKGSASVPSDFPALGPLHPGAKPNPDSRYRFITLQCRGCHHVRTIYGIPGKVLGHGCGEYYVTVKGVSEAK